MDKWNEQSEKQTDTGIESVCSEMDGKEIGDSTGG